MQSLLERVAILQRRRGDRATIRADLARVAEFLDISVDAIEKGNALGPSEENFIYVANFSGLLWAAMLADEWPRAERLAKTMAAPVVIDGTGGVSAPRVRMLAASILDDRAAFDRARSQYLEDIANPNFADVRLSETYDRYDLVMATILDRDQRAFDDVLPDRDRRFRARANEKAGSVRDGMGEHNALVIDIWSVALCHLARHRGMAVNFASEIIPSAEL